MPLFALSDGRIHLTRASSYLNIQDIAIRLLQETTIPKDPIPVLLSSFHRSYLVASTEGLKDSWSAFSYWDYSHESRRCNLVSTFGFDLDAHSDYPRSLGLNEGIVGTLAAKFLSTKSTSPHVSYDYKSDPLLAARSTIDRIGFKSGIAVPLSLSDSLAGILKLYFCAIIDKRLNPRNPALDGIAKRLTLLLRLAEDHYTRLLAATATSAFKEITTASPPLDSALARQALREATTHVIQDAAKLIGARSVSLHLKDENRSCLSTWTESPHTETVSDRFIELPLTEWNSTDGAQLGYLRFLTKPDGLALSKSEDRFLQEAKRLLSMHITSFQTITDLRIQASRRSHLLHVASQLTNYLNAASTVTDVVHVLEHGIPQAFNFASSHFFPAESDDAAQFLAANEMPRSRVLEVTGGNKHFGKLALEGRENELTSDAEFLLLTTLTVAGQALWSMEVMEIVDRTAREDARAALARDIVHSLTGDQSALINRIASLNTVIERLKSDVSKKAQATKHLGELSSRVADFMNTARTQQNILSRYEWLNHEPAESPVVAVDLQEVRRNVVAATSHRAFQKNVRVIVHGVTRELRIRWMRSEIYLIALNLLDNAVKFSRKGGEVYFALECDDSGCVMRIRDFGVGIHPMTRAKIWEVGFSTPAPGATEKTSGLGLPAVKDAVDRIPGARLDFASEKDRFTEFRLFFPTALIDREERR
jgi:signal transduction histidine kinase